MKDLIYKRLLSEDDADIFQLLQIYQLPNVSRFISIGDNYFHYVTSTPNVYFYKVYDREKLVGSIHLEKNEDIKQDILGLNYKKIEISIDESNIASIKLFENAGFIFVSKEDELMNFVFQERRYDNEIQSNLF